MDQDNLKPLNEVLEFHGIPPIVYDPPGEIFTTNQRDFLNTCVKLVELAKERNLPKEAFLKLLGSLY